MRNNKGRFDKTLWTANEVGEKIRWVQLSDERAEAEFVGKEIQKWLAAHHEFSFQDVAVFYRSHAQSRSLEEIFRRNRINYRIVGGVGFYERKEIKDALAYMRVLVNPDDSVSLLRIINVPARGLGKTTLDKVEQFANTRRLSFFAGLRKLLEEGATDVPPSAKKKLVEFVKMLDSFRDLATRSHVSEVYHHILEATGYVTELKAENSDEAQARVQNLEEFDTVIQFFEEDAKRRGLGPKDGLLQGFLNQVTLEVSLLNKEDETSNVGSVSMMTLHSSKGLEFPLVFLVGMEEGIFPSRQAIGGEEENSEGVEEERRLAYVGLTRAKQKLLLTNAQVRRIYGQVQVASASRFLAEIPHEFVEMEIQRPDTGARFGVRASWESEKATGYQSWKSKPAAATGPAKTAGGLTYEYDDGGSSSYKVQSTTVGDEGGSIAVGQKVRHAAYGLGTVKNLEGSTADRKVTIEFTGRVVKKFSLKHVQLDPA
ncbi:MAG: hypothetical protein EOP11_21170 [Proteobacteria bacterium]|nr:MAG: hypothetical protein EOP11_21170 [Pseudomonadota bacterium]